MCKLALLTPSRQHPANDLIVTRLDAIALDITSALDKDQMSVKHLMEALRVDGGPDESVLL